MIGGTPKLDLKVFAAPPSSPRRALDPARVIALFHRWIQERALDELLIDVADYSHVPGGPGVVLVAHDAVYSLDSAGGELGLLYSRRRETHASLGTIASLDDRLGSVFARALGVCARLERELEPALRFPCDRFTLWINDRRVDAAAGAVELAAALERLAAGLFPSGGVRIDAGGDGDSRPSATLRCDREHAAAELLARLAPELVRAAP